MFNNQNQEKKVEAANSTSSIIEKGTVVDGNVETVGNIRVEGTVRGNITSKAKTAHGKSSYVEGNILAQNAEIAGEVNGSIEVADLLVLKPTAIIHGDIVTNKMVVESGAVLNGTCKMGVTIKEITIESQKDRERQKESLKKAAAEVA
jgi:cytoskeletal protein CcmA (bactofilin family)